MNFNFLSNSNLNTLTGLFLGTILILNGQVPESSVFAIGTFALMRANAGDAK
jgi:hypothetical protein